MSAHFSHRRGTSSFQASSFHNIKSQIRTITRPHLTGVATETSVVQTILLITCVLIFAFLMLFLVYSCLHSFQWFRNLVDPEARFRYNADRAERSGLYAGREIGGFAHGFGIAITPERSLLCDRSAYLGGGRGYGWRNRAYGDGSVEGDADSGYGSVRSDSSGERSVKHRDDCQGQCGLTGRRGSRDPSPE